VCYQGICGGKFAKREVRTIRTWKIIIFHVASRLYIKGQRLRTLGSGVDFLLIPTVALSCMVALVHGFANIYFLFSVIHISVTVSVSCV
jgi:hypothetical protein